METIQPLFSSSILGKRHFNDIEDACWDEFNPIVDSDFDFFDSAEKRNSVSSSSSGECVSVSDVSPCSPFEDDEVVCVVSSPPHTKIKEVDHLDMYGEEDALSDPLSPAALSPAPLSPAPLSHAPLSHPEECDLSQLELSLTGEMESVWYADRPFPPFNISIGDSAGKRAMNVDHLKLAVRVIDGFGQDASDKVYGQVHNHMYNVHGGIGSINGLRFCAVSSKAGGHFRIVVTAVDPSNHSTIAPFTSPKIQVLSYRLYHAPKVSFEKLKPDDSVGKMKGIGSLYAKRFASLGIRTVEQLASLDLDRMGETACRNLLQSLRKDRGAMTLTKLSGYIQQASSIVARWNEQNEGSNKRRRVEEGANTQQHKPYHVRIEGRSIRVEGVQFELGLTAQHFQRPITCYIKQVSCA